MEDEQQALLVWIHHEGAGGEVARHKVAAREGVIPVLEQRQHAFGGDLVVWFTRPVAAQGCLGMCHS